MTETVVAGTDSEGIAPTGGPPALHDLPELITADEIAAVFRVNRKTVYDALKRRELPGVHIGRLIRFYRADVIDWLRGNGSVPRSSRRRK
jgi:excisionase family DNA binding protein